jgi:hypothetical protein
MLMVGIKQILGSRAGFWVKVSLGKDIKIPELIKLQKEGGKGWWSPLTRVFPVLLSDRPIPFFHNQSYLRLLMVRPETISFLFNTIF